MLFNLLIATFLGLVSGLLVGLINPKWVGSEKRSFVFYFMVIFLILFIVIGIFLDKTEHKPSDSESLMFLVIWIGLTYLVIGKKILSDFFLGMMMHDDTFNDEIKTEPKNEVSIPTVNFKMTVTRDYDENDFEVDQYLDDVPVYTEKRENDKYEECGYLSKKIIIHYADVDESPSEREIKVEHIYKKGSHEYIFAYCSLRGEKRTFRVDRISECYNIDTGESINNIIEYLKEVSEKQEVLRELKRKENVYFEDFTLRYKELIDFLFYVAKCDGSFNKKEKEIVLSVFKKLESDNEFITDKFMERIYRKKPIPSITIFKRTVKRIMNDENVDIDLVEVVTKMIDTQKSIHPNEQEALEYVERIYTS